AFDPLPHAGDVHRLGRSLGTPVATQIVVAAVPVCLRIGLVVLVLIAHQVVEGEAVVAGNEVDRGQWAPTAGLIEIAAAREPRGELTHLPRVAPPEQAYGIAVLAVPFPPANGELAS